MLKILLGSDVVGVFVEVSVEVLVVVLLGVSLPTGINVTLIVLDSFTVSSIGLLVLETDPDHPVKTHSSNGFAVNLITLPEVYSVVDLPADTISSETVPEPVIETVRGYFLFSKLAVIV